jgi:peptidoglycan/LPS O-acetylase OafA/YrhL
MQARRIPELDGLRGLAIALVLVVHFAINIAAKPDSQMQALFLSFVGYFRCGVDLFFVLSGFLITGILLRKRSDADYFRSFYFRRAFRILPVALVVIAGMFWVVIPILRTVPSAAKATALGNLSTSQQVWFFLFLQNMPWVMAPVALGPLWSLAVEEQFYLIWPMIVRRFYRNPARVGVWILVGGLAARIALCFAGAGIETVYKFTLCRLDGFAIGSSIAAFSYAGRSLTGFVRSARIASFIAVPVMVAEMSGILPPVRGVPFMDLLGPTLWALIFGGLLVVCLNPAGSLSAPFRAQWLRVLGRYSYALYVFHYPVIVGLRQLIRGRGGFWEQQTLMFALDTLVSVGVALISWHALEMPANNLRDRLWCRREKMAAAVA